ncbi:MAG: hypothetical protein II659_00610 [Bacteroidales bacterium]|nr:hypothetical protein [Bacteroidales bacterium]
MGKQVAYYRDGTCPQLVVRRTFGDGEGLVEFWDYKDKKWVPNADAWDVVDDAQGNWRLPEEDVEGYIERMMQRFPKLAESNIVPKPEGAKRVSKKDE